MVPVDFLEKLPGRLCFSLFYFDFFGRGRCDQFITLLVFYLRVGGVSGCVMFLLGRWRRLFSFLPPR